MIPVFSTPWDSFVLTLPKFNVDGVEGGYVSNGDDVEEINVLGGQKGGQKGGQENGQKNEEKTRDTILQLIKDTPSIVRDS